MMSLVSMLVAMILVPRFSSEAAKASPKLPGLTPVMRHHLRGLVVMMHVCTGCREPVQVECVDGGLILRGGVGSGET